MATLNEISPELFTYELYDSGLPYVLDAALCIDTDFGYCDASRLAVRPKSGLYALMVTWEDGEKGWCHIDERLLDIIRKRLRRVNNGNA